MEQVLLRNRNKPEVLKLEGYIKAGGYDGLKKALQMTPEEVVEEVKKSGLRGRGGAGFPTGIKWGFVPKDAETIYLCCNADESEPGTFKDRVLMENDPFQLVEGITIASYALKVRKAFLYIRAEFPRQIRILNEAISEAYEAGYLGRGVLGSAYSLDLILHPGAGAYICGEETGLVESIEGRRGWPRLKPPFPATKGVFDKPTIVNNVETLSCLPHIIERGAEWFASVGPQRSPGPKLFCLSGEVNNRDVFELPMGTNLREIIFDYGDGMMEGKQLKAVFPGGSSTPVLKAEETDVAMDFDSVKSAGSALGSAGIIVVSDRTCMVKVAYNLARFYADESCGQCTPCREGTYWLEQIFYRIEHGEGEPDDIDTLRDIFMNIFGNVICPLGDGAVMPLQSILDKFTEEFEEHIRKRRCPMRE